MENEIVEKKPKVVEPKGPYFVLRVHGEKQCVVGMLVRIKGVNVVHLGRTTIDADDCKFLSRGFKTLSAAFAHLVEMRFCVTE